MLQGRTHHIILKGMKYTDAHCHIFTAPADNVAAQVCNATTTADWQKLTPMADDRTRVCIGIHPWHIDSAVPDWAEQMRKILSSNPQIMVGEIGIDKYHPDIDRQIEFFAQQIEIAIEMNRPVQLHCVGAWDKVLHILKGHRPHIPIIAHAFGGNAKIMLMLSEYNTYFSYVARNGRINDTAGVAPLDQILVESDSDTSATQTEILTTATREIAKLRECDAHELNEQINKNFTGVINYAG